MVGPQAKKLGEALVAAKLLLPEQLESAMAAASRESAPSLIIGLMESGFLTYKVFEKFVTNTFSIRAVIMGGKRADSTLVKKLGTELIHSRFIFPIAMKDAAGKATLILGMVDPLDENTIKSVEQKMGCKVDPVLISLPDFKESVQMNLVSPSVDLPPPIVDERFSLVRAERYEEEIAFQADAEKTKSRASISQPSSRPQSPVYFGPQNKRTREEVISRLRLKEDDARHLKLFSYSREELYRDLDNLTDKRLEKMRDVFRDNFAFEALGNALIDKGLLTKHEIMVSAAVSFVFKEGET